MKTYHIRFLLSDFGVDERTIHGPTMARAWEVIVKNYPQSPTAAFPVAIITIEEQFGHIYQWVQPPQQQPQGGASHANH